MSVTVTHRALVESVESASHAIVHLDAASDDAARCGTCSLAAACRRGGESAAVPFRAEIRAGVTVMPGDRVDVVTASSTGRLALFLLMILPVLAMIAGAAAAVRAGLSQPWAAAAGFGALLLTGTVLYLLRRRIDRSVRWTIIGTSTQTGT